MTIVIGTTLAAYVMDQEDTWGAWLRNAAYVKNSVVENVHYFVAIETDARGLDPFRPLLAELEELDGSYWTFDLDDGRTEVTTPNRGRHITMGQNLVFDFCASDITVSHCLFLAADTEVPPDALPMLLEVDRPVVGANCPTYCLPGTPVNEIPDERHYPFPVQTWDEPQNLTASAAAMFFQRQAFRKLRWRWDLDAGMTDDPCMQWDAWFNHGWKIYVRMDCVAIHHPQAIPGIEYRGHDRTVVR